MVVPETYEWVHWLPVILEQLTFKAKQREGEDVKANPKGALTSIVSHEGLKNIVVSNEC